MHTDIRTAMRRVLISTAAGAGTLALALGTTTAAQAHVSATATDTAAGAHTVVSLSVPHGCDGAATTKVAVKIPEGVNAVTPTRNAFYTVDTVPEKLAEPITDGHGNTVTERVAQVVYTAQTPLPADQRDTFELSLQLPESAADSTVYFPTVQTCEKGSAAWVQIPEDGQDGHDLELPAPAVKVGPAEDADTEAAPAAGAPTGSSAGLSITALVVGALGLVVGAAALLTRRKRG